MPERARPRVSIPELPTVGPSTPPASAAGSAKKPPNPAASKSGNWLLEAMERPRDGRDSREPRDGSRRQRERPDHEPKIGFETNHEPEAGKPKSDDARFPAGERVAPDNPLTQYLADWMTPRDYALLRPGLSDAFSFPRPGESASASSLLPAATTSVTETMGAWANPRGLPSTQPRTNPFLETLNLGAGAMMAPPSIPAIKVSPVTPAPIPPASVAAPPPSVQMPIPDFARPTHDEKYFKQLKRF